METTMEQVADQAVAPTAEHFVERVRRRTRKKFTADEKVRIVIEGMKREISIAERAAERAWAPVRMTPRLSWLNQDTPRPAAIAICSARCSSRIRHTKRG